MSERIQIVMTGGTIDSYYDIRQDTVIPKPESDIPRYIDAIRPYVDISYTTVCMKDSRSLDDADRHKLVETIETSEAQNVIVTHGTYTMPDTARYLGAQLVRRDQSIVLTGSMMPIDGFAMSDAGFNLGFAVSEVQRLESGIYVAMNARIFQPDEVVKELAEGRFNSIFNQQ